MRQPTTGAASRKPRAGTHVFRVRLGPRVYRDVEIESGKSLYDLAAAIVRAFGFDLDHAFGFFSKLDYHVFDSPVRYELFADMGPDPGSKARSVKIAVPHRRRAAPPSLAAHHARTSTVAGLVDIEAGFWPF